jgi:hypothetical protein
MPKYKNFIKAYGRYVVEAEDAYAADEMARKLTLEDMDKVNWTMIEGDQDELPQEI